MMAHSQGALTVTYMLSNPPTKVPITWTSTSVLHPWLSHHGMRTYAMNSPTSYDPVVQLDGRDSPTLRNGELSGHYDRLDIPKLANNGQYDMSDQPDLTNHEIFGPTTNYDGAQEVITTDTAFPSRGSTSSSSFPNSNQATKLRLRCGR